MGLEEHQFSFIAFFQQLINLIYISSFLIPSFFLHLSMFIWLLSSWGKILWSVIWTSLPLSPQIPNHLFCFLLSAGLRQFSIQFLHSHVWMYSTVREKIYTGSYLGHRGTGPPISMESSILLIFSLFILYLFTLQLPSAAISTAHSSLKAFLSVSTLPNLPSSSSCDWWRSNGHKAGTLSTSTLSVDIRLIKFLLTPSVSDRSALFCFQGPIYLQVPLTPSTPKISSYHLSLYFPLFLICSTVPSLLPENMLESLSP